MLSIFKPTWMVESIYNISPSDLKKFNIESVFTDLDNTLIAWNDPHAQEQTINWIERLRKHGISVIIISNNKGDRVEQVAKSLNIAYVSRAAKPSRRGFRSFFESSKIDKKHTLMVGDQVLTDVLAANRIGIKSVLVKPILDSDAWNTRINRFIELFILKFIIQKDPELKWSETIGRKPSK